MDHFSITAGTVGILDCVARLSSAMSRFKDDYKLADADLDITRQHALLLKQEIRALESKKGSHHPLRSEPHTWRRKVRWAMKDKQVLLQVKEQLQSTESTLQGIVAMEQL